MPTISTNIAKENVGVASCFVGKKMVPTSADDTAGYADMPFPELITLFGYVVFIVTTATGANILADAKVTNPSGTTVRVADGAATYTVQAADTITIIAFGQPAG
jgi:hypothetical protein